MHAGSFCLALRAPDLRLIPRYSLLFGVFFSTGIAGDGHSMKEAQELERSSGTAVYAEAHMPEKGSLLICLGSCGHVR